MDISPALEDYLESILIIRNKKQVVRVKDIADFLNVKAPSVSDALSTLKQKNLVVQERYGAIEMTPDGVKLAEKIFSKHISLTSFFSQVLNLDEHTAEDEACKIEHYLSKETLRRIELLTLFFDRSVPSDMKHVLHAMFDQKITSCGQTSTKL